MKYIVSLFILVFVYSKVSPKYFLHVFKNRGVRRFLSSEIRIHWYVVLKYAFWFIVLFLSASVIFKILSQTAKWNILHNFVEKGISKDEEKLFQLLSKKAAVLTLFRIGLFVDAQGWGGKSPLPKICQTYHTMMKPGTLIPYLKKIPKMYKSHDAPLEFCWHWHFYQKFATFVILRNTDKGCILMYNFYFF